MKTILLADDEENLRLLVRATLEDPDWKILEACDGREALELAQAQPPDLLVLDWRMPGLSGIEVARTLSSDPRTSQIPIVMLTANGQDADRELGLSVGVRAYLVKPFSPLEFLELIENLLD